MLHVQVSSCHCLHCSLSWTAEPGRLRFWLRQAVMETSSRMLGFKQFADKGRARAQKSLCSRRPRLADWKLRADLDSALEKWLSAPLLHVCRLNCISESLIKCWAAELWEVPSLEVGASKPRLPLEGTIPPVSFIFWWMEMVYRCFFVFSRLSGLSGITMVFTGEMDQITRHECEEKAKAAGAKVPWHCRGSIKKLFASRFLYLRVCFRRGSRQCFWQRAVPCRRFLGLIQLSIESRVFLCTCSE